MKSAMEQMVQYCEGICQGEKVVSIGEITEYARRLLLEEQAQKPTAPAGLVEILKSFVEKYDGEGGFDWINCDYTNGFEMLAKEILSRYRPAAGTEKEGA